VVAEITGWDAPSPFRLNVDAREATVSPWQAEFSKNGRNKVRPFIRCHFFAAIKHVSCCINPYAKPSERKVGARRPKISHLPRELDTRTRKERQTEKQAVAAERRAIKKSVRRHLKKQLLADLDNL
jgi:hypothetical protein